MEQMDYYADVDVVSPNEQNRDGCRPGKLKTDRGMKAEDRIRHKLSAPVVYSLLGLSILLSAAALCVAVILFGAVIKTQLGLKNPEQGVHSSPEQWTTFKQSCYHFSTSSNTWVEAQRSCASADAHLVVINNAEEQGFLKKHVDVIRWIGLSDSASEGDWRWVDGTDYISSVKFWNVGEPNNKGVERCVEMLDFGPWNDQECSDLSRWICEKPAQRCSP